MNSKIIQTYLSPYNEKSRFLKSFELVDNKGVAIFEINSDFYCNAAQPVHYFTAVELQVCINQLLYIYCTHMGLLPFSEDTVPNEDFIKSLDENNLIVEQTAHFKKKIDSSQTFRGEIELSKSRKLGKTLLIGCNFMFGEGCFGTVKVILKNGEI